MFSPIQSSVSQFPRRVPSRNNSPTHSPAFFAQPFSSLRNRQSLEKFGNATQKNQGSPSFRELYRQGKDYLINRFRYVVRGIETLQANIKMGFVVSACILTFLPIPDFLRRYIEQIAFFGPIKSSDIGLLKDKTLRQQTSEHFFNQLQTLSAEKPALLKHGVILHPTQDNVRLNGWFVKASKPGMPTVLYHHGRGSNISNLGRLMKVLSGQGYGVFVYDYPGFGKSEGAPSEEGVYNAGLAASYFLRDTLHIPQSQQIMMGYSLGSSIATDITVKLSKLQQPPLALVLVNTFPSIKTTFIERQKQHYAWTRSLFNPNKIKLVFDTEAKLKTLSNISVLVLQGQQDQDTPIPMLHDMLDRVERPRDTLEALKNAKHRLQEKDYDTIGAHFSKFMQRTFPDLPYPNE